jgi:hypothetical protein
LEKVYYFLFDLLGRKVAGVEVEITVLPGMLQALVLLSQSLRATIYVRPSGSGRLIIHI